MARLQLNQPQFSTSYNAIVFQSSNGSALIQKGPFLKRKQNRLF